MSSIPASFPPAVQLGRGRGARDGADDRQMAFRAWRDGGAAQAGDRMEARAASSFRALALARRHGSCTQPKPRRRRDIAV